MDKSTKRRVDIGAVRAYAAGQWAEIFRSMVPGVDENLLNRPGRKHGGCPVCGGSDRFQFFSDMPKTGGSNCRSCGPKPDGFQLLQHVHGWTFIEAVRAVDEWLGGVTPEVVRRAPPPPVTPKEPDQEQIRKARQKLRKVWSESYPLTAPEAESARRYLANRGLTIEQYPKTVRFHPGLASFNEDGEFEGKWPTMVAMVVDAKGDPVTIHRTFLSKNGAKAPVEKAKKLMAYPQNRDLSGGAIHLTGTGKVLNLTEGIETAFAVQQMTKGAVWSTISSSLLRNVRVGEPVKAVWVWGDLDRSGDGQNSAHALVERLRSEGIQATAVLPNVMIPEGQKSIDWLDVMNEWYDAIVCDRVQLIRRTQCRVA